MARTRRPQQVRKARSIKKKQARRKGKVTTAHTQEQIKEWEKRHVMKHVWDSQGHLTLEIDTNMKVQTRKELSSLMPALLQESRLLTDAELKHIKWLKGPTGCTVMSKTENWTSTILSTR